VRRSFFTPVGVTGKKIPLSKAITGTAPKVDMPSLAKSQSSSSGGGGSDAGGIMGGIASLWNAPFEQKRAQEKTAEVEKLRRDALAMAASNKAPVVTSDDAASTSSGTTGGVPQGMPLPGGSYEAKARALESGGNDAAVNASGAAGRYQFMPSTAEGLIKANPHLNISSNWRTNADDQEKLMKVYTDTSRELLRKALGREPTGGELYALHMFGHGKGPTIVGAGNAPLASVTSEAERSGNPWLKRFATAADLMAYFNKRFS
jgi:hypothetical protein